MIVTVSCLGNNGRFGNQLFQYAFARAYAEQIGAELQTPYWAGRELFIGIDETIMSAPAGPSVEFPNGEGNIDLYGYFQQPEHLKLLSRSKLKEWFTFKSYLADPFLLKDYNVKKHSLILHKRRGDYLSYQDIFAIVSDQSYESSVTSFGFNINDAVIFDDSRHISSTIEDFITMMHCDNLFRSNSTYSWWAATLGTCNVYSPVVKDNKGIIDTYFVKGNEEPLGSFTGEMKIDN